MWSPLAIKRSYALLGTIALGVFWVLLQFSRRDGPITFGSVTRSTVVPGHSAFGLTNTTARQIHYQVSRPQFKRDGVWSEFYAPVEFISMGTGQPLISVPPETVTAVSWSTVVVARPMHITAPLGATSWRVGVVWSYASPTRFEQLRSQALDFITRRSPRYDRIAYTNFSPEVKL